jgi:hypothetical protein
MVDGNMGADGEGAFTPTRIGSVPVLQLLDYIEAHSVAEVRLRCSRAGGFVDLFGTSNSDTIHSLVEKGDRKATLVWNTMIYQVCKMIGEMSAVLCGKVDGILLTGGLLRFADVEEGVRRKSAIIKEYLDKVAAMDSRLEIRGIGFLWGVDCNKVKPDVISKAISRECFDNGLICERAGRNNDVVKLMPCLLADEETLRKGLEIFVSAVRKALSENA